MKFIEEAWKLLGWKIRPMRRLVIVRTLPIPTKSESGLLHLPSSLTGFYDGLANKKIIEAYVLRTGPGVTQVREGDKVLFMRISFARFERLAGDEESYLGYLDETEILGKLEAEETAHELT